MASAEDVAVITGELNKLKKNEIIDIFVTLKVPKCITNSRLIDYVSKIRDTCKSSGEKEEFHDTFETAASMAEQEVIQLRKEQGVLQRELETVGKLTIHLEKRAQEQEDLIVFLKKEILSLQCIHFPNSNKEQHTPSTIDKHNNIKPLQLPTDHISPASSSYRDKVTKNSQQINRPADPVSQSAKNSTFLGKANDSSTSTTYGNYDNKQTSTKRMNTNRPKPIIGTNENGVSHTVGKRGYLHVYRFKPEMTENELKALLNRSAPQIDFTCNEWHRSITAVSFKISFPIQHVKEVYDPNIWPAGAAVRRFFFPKKQNFPNKRDNTLDT
nr:unnamed protein product [Callosobruchus analis]